MNQTVMLVGIILFFVLAEAFAIYAVFIHNKKPDRRVK